MRAGSGSPAAGKADGRTHINKNEHNGAWDFQRRFQVKPNYGSARNFRMKVPLPYCNSGIGYSVLMGGIQGADIA